MSKFFCPVCRTEMIKNPGENSWCPTEYVCPADGTKILDHPGDFQPNSYELFPKWNKRS